MHPILLTPSDAQKSKSVINSRHLTPNFLMPLFNVILFQGGLGNQMFQYANALAVRQKHPFSLMLFDCNRSVETHGGLLIFDLFDIKEKGRLSRYKVIKQYLPKLLSAYRQDDYDGSRTGRCLSRRYMGFYQSEKYFARCSDKVRKTFRFNTAKLNTKSIEAARQMANQQCLSIHIRRGDYLNENGKYDTYSLDYYHQGLQYIEQRVGSCIPYIFSDDIDWCRANLPLPNAVYVDWNDGADSWQDMYLMSRCSHNIIANSTFSWWGAWLNPNAGKIVVAPKQWTSDSNKSDIIPSSWIKI